MGYQLLHQLSWWTCSLAAVNYTPPPKQKWEREKDEMWDRLTIRNYRNLADIDSTIILSLCVLLSFGATRSLMIGRRRLYTLGPTTLTSLLVAWAKCGKQVAAGFFHTTKTHAKTDSLYTNTLIENTCEEKYTLTWVNILKALICLAQQ